MYDAAVRPGQVFEDRYEISNLLGTGGFGEVWRATQRSTGQPVAIKVMRHDGGPADERAVARFRREMQLCGALRHPNIVRLVDTGTTAEGVLYTVFEYVPGQTLAEALHIEGALSPVEARRVMIQVLDALGAAHALGVIHRDLKPQNIMLTRTGARRNALVLDFGIGTLVGDGSVLDLETLTSSHEVLGTPAYASPEQLRGEPLTPASDLYSWGLVFLECLTGQRVMRARRFHELVYQQTGPEPVRLPRWLDVHALGAVLRAALEKDVDLRAREAADLLRPLELCDVGGLRTGGEPVASTTAIITPRIQRGASAADDTLPGPMARTVSTLTEIPRAPADPSRGEFIGRAEEQALIAERWRRTLSGSGQALLLLGEAGIGKSRLLEQIGAVVRATGQTWIPFSCRRGGPPPSVALARLLLGEDARWDTDEVLAALHASTASGALALTLDDLHEADEPLLELVGELLHDLSSAPILVAAAALPDFASPWTAGAILPVPLAALEPAQAAALALARAGDMPLSDAVIDDLVRRADGVPLFVEGLVELLRQHSDADELTVRRRLAEEVPPEVRAAVWRRLERLGPARQLARAAALLGTELDRERLRLAIDQRPEDVELHLQVLANADLLVRRRRGRAVEWAFRHALVRDAIHDMVMESERRVIASRLAANGL